MAKVKSPLFSLYASGNLKKVLIYTSAKGTQIVKKFFKSLYTRTEEQDFIRTAYDNGVIAWHASSPEVKEEWSERAKNMKMTGFNLYLSDYIKTEIKKRLWGRYGVARYGVNTYAGVA